jgi:hypothetical protein
MCPRRERVAFRLITRTWFWGSVVTAWDPSVPNAGWGVCPMGVSGGWASGSCMRESPGVLMFRFEVTEVYP